MDIARAPIIHNKHIHNYSHSHIRTHTLSLITGGTEVTSSQTMTNNPIWIIVASFS